MEKKKLLLLRLGVSLVFWGLLAVGILLLPPVPQEPDNLLAENWSYYGSQSPPGNQLLRYRNEILFVIVICAIFSEVLFFGLEKRKKRQ